MWQTFLAYLAVSANKCYFCRHCTMYVYGVYVVYQNSKITANYCEKSRDKCHSKCFHVFYSVLYHIHAYTVTVSYQCLPYLNGILEKLFFFH